jgi:putative hydrolase of the HAD superfamily
MSNQVKNIIFDFGGVIIPIDPMAYAGAMIGLGCNDIHALHELFISQQVYVRFEKGEMSPEDFRLILRQGLSNHVADEKLDHAWNLILGKIPSHRVKFLESLKSKYRTFLLSNINKIHYDHCQDQFCKAYGYASLDQLFEKAYYSFQLKLHKPDPAIFEFVLHDSGLKPEETLFIDDFTANVESARKCGMQAIHLAVGMEVAELIREK